MNPESEDFQPIIRALSLKRHEIPPPGYFARFSTQVITRIEAGETGAGASAGWNLSVWLNQVWSALDARPALAGALGVCICGLFAVGVVMSDRPDSAIAQIGDPQSFAATLPERIDRTEHIPSPLGTRTMSVELPSTEGSMALPVQNSLFDQMGMPQARLVSFPVQNN